MKHDCSIENAERFGDWIKNRGGVAVWKSADLGDPGKTWSAPYLELDGTVKPKQSWQMEDKPRLVVTDPAEIELYKGVEHKRFHVGVRQGGNGCSLKITDAGSARIRREIKAAGEGAYYEFDYDDEKNCVIYKTETCGALKDWMDKNADTSSVPRS